MGYTASGGPRGLGVFNTPPSTAADFNKLVELIGRVGNYRGPVTETERDAISGDELYEGLKVYNTTADALELYDGSGWVITWVPATSPGSVVPVAGSSVTLSNNELYTRDGWLLGTIDWSLSSGALSHGQTILTLPVGARPDHEYHAMVSASPSPSSLFQLVIESGGLVKANQPTSSRTAGRIAFTVPIPLA